MATPQLDVIIADFPAEQSAMLPILHAVQHAHGFISEAALVAIAAYINLSRAEVYGTASFYHDFRLTDDPRPTVSLCRAEACQARGAEAIAAVMKEEARGHVEIKTVYCLGLCSVGPAAMVDDIPYARLDQDSARSLILRQC